MAKPGSKAEAVTLNNDALFTVCFTCKQLFEREPGEKFGKHDSLCECDDQNANTYTDILTAAQELETLLNIRSDPLTRATVEPKGN